MCKALGESPLAVALALAPARLLSSRVRGRRDDELREQGVRSVLPCSPGPLAPGSSSAKLTCGGQGSRGRGAGDLILSPFPVPHCAQECRGSKLLGSLGREGEEG